MFQWILGSTLLIIVEIPAENPRRRIRKAANHTSLNPLSKVTLKLLVELKILRKG